MTGKKERDRMLSPNAVLETKTVFSNGSSQIDRTIYDENGLIKVLIHSGPHNRPDQHKYGRHGEHKHVFTWKEGGSTRRKSGKNEQTQNAGSMLIYLKYGKRKNDKRRY